MGRVNCQTTCGWGGEYLTKLNPEKAEDRDGTTFVAGGGKEGPDECNHRSRS